VLAAAIRIDAVLKPDVRAVVAGDDLAATVAQEEGARQRVLFRVPIRVPLERDLVKAVGRVAAGTPATWTRRPLAHESNLPHFSKMVECCLLPLALTVVALIAVGGMKGRHVHPYHVAYANLETATNAKTPGGRDAKEWELARGRRASTCSTHACAFTLIRLRFSGSL